MVTYAGRSPIISLSAANQIILRYLCIWECSIFCTVVQRESRAAYPMSITWASYIAVKTAEMGCYLYPITNRPSSSVPEHPGLVLTNIGRKWYHWWKLPGWCWLEELSKFCKWLFQRKINTELQIFQISTHNQHHCIHHHPCQQACQIPSICSSADAQY